MHAMQNERGGKPYCLYLASSFSTPAAKSSSFFSKPSPRTKRSKRRMMRFSPSLAMRSFRTSCTVLSSSLRNFWFIRDISSYFFLRRPSTIFSLMFSGLPSRSSLAISSAFAFSLTSAGTSSAETQTTVGFAAICIATSVVNSLKMALLATKSVSLFTSTRTAILELKCTYDAIAPSTETLPAFLSALAMPFFLSHSSAFSMSPPLSFSAFLESRIPAPDRWRSSLTCAAEIAGPESSALASGGGSALGFSSSLGFSALGSSGACSPAVLYLASSFSTPAAKSASFFSRPSPRFRRTKRRMTRFSPSLAMRSFRTSCTLLSSSLSHFWFSKAISSYLFFSRPKTIFSLMLSGFPARSSLAISSALALALTSSGTSSAEMQATEGLAAICIATSLANSWKMALLATKSVSLFTSTMTPSLLLKCTYDAMPPSTETLPAFLSALAMPLFRSQSMALSMSPSVSLRAFWQSRMPARERSRSSFTALAEIFSPTRAAATSLGAASSAGGVQSLKYHCLPRLPMRFFQSARASSVLASSTRSMASLM
mmetsp:Transcript_75774/g.235064  ORF Transcript_75774/g.235064 Transcript_75774/m.235064 type:complete len:542 (-) Transcript_75774:251-1876(-)